MGDYLAPEWEGPLRRQGLADFEVFWNLEADWFEPPNRRRGGWSGVSRIEVDGPQGTRVGLFLKRQEDHVHRSLRHPIRGEPTFRRELRNILAYRRAEIPALEPVYFGQRRVGRHQRAVLVTEELAGFRSLAELFETWPRDERPDRASRRKLLAAVASLVSAIHAQRLQHNCLYPKHLFARRDGTEWDVRVIDLEKTKRVRDPWRARVRDIGTLHRYASGWSRTDRLRFLLQYFGTRHLTSSAKRLARRVLRENVRKHAERAAGQRVR